MRTYSRRGRSFLLVIAIFALFGLSLVVLSSTFAQQAAVARVESRQSAYPCGPTTDINTAIHFIYCAYGGESVFGVPLSGFETEQKWSHPTMPQDGDRWQRFWHGTIYYVAKDRTAYALFNKVRDLYEEDMAIYGKPITSEIGNASEGTCKAYFTGDLILDCQGASDPVKVNWGRNSYYLTHLPNTSGVAPPLQMPFNQSTKGTFNAGPHEPGPKEGINGVIFLDRNDPNFGSGLDIGFTGDVANMAGGVVVGVKRDDDCAAFTSGLGCWVAIRNSFSGTVIIYGHIYPGDGVKKGDWIEQGNIIGRIEPCSESTCVGASTGPHVHLELRDGRDARTYSSLWSAEWGNPLPWHGVIIGKYLISGGYTTELTPFGNVYDYDGTATRVDSVSRGLLGPHRIYQQHELIGKLTGQGFVFKGHKFKDYQEAASRDIYQWLTQEAWDECEARSAGDPDKMDCEGLLGSSYGGTVFSYGSLERLARANALLDQDEAILESSNIARPYDPLFSPSDDPFEATPVPPPNISACPTDNRDGVYFYDSKNYDGNCIFTIDDIPDFGATPLGDNSISSVRIHGRWKLQLFEDADFGGRYDRLSKSDDNLDENSLGDQYSSVRITEDVQVCPTDGRSGVYLYSDKDYQGRCLFTTEDIPYFGDTGLGNNDLSSIRFVGDWETKIFEDANYGGRYDVIGSNDPNLDIRSLGGQYSSIRITENTSACPTDGREGVYMYSSRDYQGRCLFATQNIADFGATNLGNNDLSSIRFIGHWQTKIFEDANYGGRYDDVGSDDPNLDIRSLGGQYSSITIAKKTVVPVGTPTPLPTAAPTVIALIDPSTRNGGFESGTMDGWQQEGGTFVVDTEHPHTGQYYVKGTAAEDARFYQLVDLSEYRTEIDQGLASAYFAVWVDVGKSEQFQLVFDFLDGNDISLWRYDSGLLYISGEHYVETGGNLELIPPGTRKVKVQLRSIRSSGNFTDADFDDVTLVLQIADPVDPTAAPPVPSSTPTVTPTPIVGCENVVEDAVVFFDSATCSNQNGLLRFGISDHFYDLDGINWDKRISSIFIPNGWSVRAFSGPTEESASRCIEQSAADLSEFTYENVEQDLNNTIMSVKAFSRVGCEDIQPDYNLSVTPLLQNVAPGQSVSFEVGVTPIDGYFEPLLLDVANLPPGASAEINPRLIYPPGQATVTVSASNDLVSGVHVFQIRSDNGKSIRERNVILNVAGNIETLYLPMLRR